MYLCITGTKHEQAMGWLLPEPPLTFAFGNLSAEGRNKSNLGFIAQNGCSCSWAAQAFWCFAEHGKSSLLVAGARGSYWGAA